MRIAVAMLAALIGADEPQARTLFPAPDIPVTVSDLVFFWAKDGDSILIAYDVPAYIELMKTIKALDTDGLDELKRRGEVVEMESGTTVARVLEFRARDAAINHRICEVRVLTGPKKGRKYFADERDLSRFHVRAQPILDRTLTPAEKIQAEKELAEEQSRNEQVAHEMIERAAQKTREANRLKAASLLRAGQNLEKLGKTAGALDFYRRIVKELPATEQAKAARARIKALAKR